jgi:hypothetical protein
MNTDPLRAPETDEEPWIALVISEPEDDGPGWPAAWALLAVGIVALVVFAWSRS